MYYAYAPDPRDEAEPRDPATPGARCSTTIGGAIELLELPAAHAAGQPDRLLRRRDRHGRQRPPRRPRRRAHADAVVGATATPASPAPSPAQLYLPVIDRSRLRLPDGERRRAGRPARRRCSTRCDGSSPRAGGRRPSGAGRIEFLRPRNSGRARLPAPLAGRHAPDRGQPLRPRRSRSSWIWPRWRAGPGRDARRHALSADPPRAVLPLASARTATTG